MMAGEEDAEVAPGAALEAFLLRVDSVDKAMETKQKEEENSKKCIRRYLISQANKILCNSAL